MKKRALWIMCAGVLSLNLFSLRSRAEPEPKLLPLKRVRLYQVGVGYFERTGVLRAHSDLALSLPQSQLDDVLTSLVIVGGSGKSRVSRLEFGSRESADLARSDASLSADPSAPLEFASVLRSFRGVEVEVRQQGSTLRGQLVDVISLAQASAEQCAASTVPATDATRSTAPAPTPCNPAPDANLVLLDADGTLARVALSRVASVRALDASVAARLSRALDAISGRNAARGHEILHVHGSGSAALTLGYVAEAPVWRPSYRLVLDAAEHTGKLQGFALIHNDTDEAWRGVKLELVNGRPSSFLYPLAAPRYARRPLVTPEEPLTTIPQLSKGTPDDAWAPEPDGEVSGSESFGAGGLGLEGVAEGGGGRGEGIGLGAVGSIGHGAGTSDVLDVGNLTNLANATGIEGAAQFLYALGAPVDLGAHASALVPFVDEPLTLTRVTWFGDDDGDGETGVRLVNSSTQTLPAGVLSVFSEAGFSGSSVLPRTKPGETRVLRFGRDLDVTLERTTHDVTIEPRLYSFESGQLSEHALRSSKIRCELSNKSIAERTVSVALNIVVNARVEGADEATYDSALARAVVSFRLPAGASAVRELGVTEGIVTPIPAESVSSEFLKHAASLGAIDPVQRALLRRAGDAQYQAEIRRGALPKRKAEIDEALSDASRLESHVRALGPSSDEAHLAAERLRRTEDRLSELRQRVRALDSEISEYEARTRTTLEALGHGTALKVERSLEAPSKSAG
jgi:hypothetical protein